MELALELMFPDDHSIWTDVSTIEPFSIKTFRSLVLVQEVIRHLIEEELYLSETDAFATMQNSTWYGEFVFDKVKQFEDAWMETTNAILKGIRQPEVGLNVCNR